MKKVIKIKVTDDYPDAIDGFVCTLSSCTKDGLAVTKLDKKSGFAVTHIKSGLAVADDLQSYTIAKNILNKIIKLTDWTVEKDLLPLTDIKNDIIKVIEEVGETINKPKTNLEKITKSKWWKGCTVGEPEMHRFSFGKRMARLVTKGAATAWIIEEN